MRCYYFFIFEVIAESVNLITDVKIEQKIIITMTENNYFLKKLTSKHTEQKDVVVIILLQETKNSNLYNKNYTNVKTRTSNNIFNMKKVDLDES